LRICYYETPWVHVTKEQVDNTDAEGCTALMVAAGVGALDITAELLSKVAQTLLIVRARLTVYGCCEGL
jgi:hypothetical protein